jgi:hypothetical protein
MEEEEAVIYERYRLGNGFRAHHHTPPQQSFSAETPVERSLSGSSLRLFFP